jgi:hypothetical protein
MSLRMPCTAFLLATMLSGSTSLVAQGQPAPPDCNAASFREFDFWVGSWVVMSGADTAGTNNVTLEEDGCVIHEHWVGSKGGTGQSFNFYDRQDRKWHQVWVDNVGSVLRLAGELVGNQLVLSGETVRRNGTKVLHRLAFTRNTDGTVRQFWESSPDMGKTWSVSFDGIYRKAR